MKSIIRFSIALLIAVIAATPAFSARAQGTNCYGLADADCQLYYGALAPDNMAKFASFAMDYTLAAKIKTTGATAQDADIKVEGSGSFSGDPKSFTAANPSAGLSSLLFSNVIKANVTSNGSPMAGDVEVRVTGGNAYFNSAMFTQGKWQFVPLSAATGGMSGMTGGAGAAASDPALMKSFMDVLASPGVIKAEAKDGPEVDGQATKQFTFTLDAVALTKAPELRPLLKQALAAQAKGAPVDDQQVEAVATLAGSALKDSTFAVSWLVGTSDKIFHGVGLNIVLKIDDSTAKLLKMDGPVDATVDFNIQVSKVGEPVTVEVPADAAPFSMGGMSPDAMATPAK
ncbi:MAG: hypothetical protein ABI947_19500 [Chloroflexota bacterium]